jgi:hypothetical protein
VEECFSGVLVMAGTSMSVDEVMEEILKDVPYYRHSGGGVTFSGGEPVLQKEFLLALLRRCKEDDLHTAIETAGNYSWTYLKTLLPYIDLVMYDLKIFDPDLHLKHIGNKGGRARENLLRLAASRRTDIRSFRGCSPMGSLRNWVRIWARPRMGAGPVNRFRTVQIPIRGLCRTAAQLRPRSRMP